MKPKHFCSQPLINNFLKKKNWVQSFVKLLCNASKELPIKQMHILSQEAISTIENGAK